MFLCDYDLDIMMYVSYGMMFDLFDLCYDYEYPR